MNDHDVLLVLGRTRRAGIGEKFRRLNHLVELYESIFLFLKTEGYDFLLNPDHESVFEMKTTK